MELAVGGPSARGGPTHRGVPLPPTKMRTTHGSNPISSTGGFAFPKTPPNSVCVVVKDPSSAPEREGVSAKDGRFDSIDFPPPCRHLSNQRCRQSLPLRDQAPACQRSPFAGRLDCGSTISGRLLSPPGEKENREKEDERNSKRTKETQRARTFQSTTVLRQARLHPVVLANHTSSLICTSNYSMNQGAEVPVLAEPLAWTAPPP